MLPLLLCTYGQQARMSQQPQVQCLPEQDDTSLCLPKGNKAPTLQRAQDSQSPDPDQLQLHTGVSQR